MNVIAKMDVRSVEDFGWSRKIKFACVCDSKLNSKSEDRAFSQATPSGEAWMTVDNKGVWPAFRLPDHSDPQNYRQASQHYVVFIDAGKHSLKDVYRALAALDAEE